MCNLQLCDDQNVFPDGKTLTGHLWRTYSVTLMLKVKWNLKGSKYSE